MRLIKSFLEKAIMALLLLVATTTLTAQNPTYLCELRNDVQVDARTYEFDVYLLRTGTIEFEFTSMQFGININSGMRNGGTITVSIVSGSSELNPLQIPTNARFSFDNATNCIRMTGTPPPGAGGGTIISNVGTGTRLGRIRLVNTAVFGTVTPDLVWSYSLATGYITRVNAYVSGLATDITVQASQTTSNLVNPLLNPPAPIAYSVTGGGEFCEGGTGMEVGLSDSETGVTYTLVRGTTDLTPTVDGTGNSITFGLQTVAGTYTVRGTNAGGTTPMTGSAIVTITPLPAQPEPISGPANPCPNTAGNIYEVPAVPGATSYTWSIGSGTITAGQGTRTVTVTSGTSDGNLVVYASNACGNSPTRDRWLVLGSVSTAPTSVNITNNNTCFGTSKTITVSGGSLGTGAAWEWFTGSCGGTAAGTGPSITVNPAAGTSTTYYVRAAGTCNTTACANGTVTVPANVGTPTTPVPSAATICQGTPSITVTTSATNATSYNWTVTGAGNSVTGTGATATVNFNSGFSGVATINVTASGCSGPSTQASTNVTVRPTPSASISGTTSVCQGSAAPNVTFTNPQPLAVTITYNIGGANEASINVPASGSVPLTVPTTTAGTFTYNLVSVAYQTAPVCPAPVTGSATVTVNPTPSVANQSESITTGSTFTVTPTGVPGGTTYTWPVPAMSGGVTGGVAQSTGASSISGTLSVPSGSGTAIYTVTPRTGTCVGPTFTVTVTVTSTCDPVAFTTHPVNTSMCAGGSASFSAATSGTSPDYQWQYYNGAAWVSVANGVPTGAVYTNATTTTLGVSGITLVGSYQYRCYATNCTVSNAQSSAATLTVNAIPAQPTVTVIQPTCSAATGTITVTAPTGTGMTYSIDGTTYTNTNGVFSNVTPGSYNVTARSSAGCTSPIRIAIVNDQPPTPVIGNQTASINTSQTFNVTPTGVPVGTTYTWTVPVMTGGVTGGVAQATGVTSISGTLTIPSGNGTAVYTVTPTAGTCVGNTFTVTVTVSSSCLPVTITADPVNASICSGGNASFSVTASGTSPAYQWQYYNGSAWVSVVNGTPAGAVYTNATTATLGVSGITAAGSYQYRCNATNCSVSNDQSNAATLTVNAIPAQPTVTVTQPTCSTATGTITVTAPTGTGMTYSIDGTTYTNTNGVFSNVTPGSYNVTARSSAGCTSPIRVATVNDQPPTPVIGNQTASINSGQTFNVTPAGAPAGTTYTWTIPTYTGGVTGGVAQATGVTSISGTLTIPSGNGTAVYTVTPTAGICVGNPFTVTVNVSSSCIPVTITADPVNASICSGGSTTFSVTATGTSPAYQWQYYNGATWVSVANGTPAGAVYTNATTATLGVSGITAAGTFRYRCEATNCSVSSDLSAEATLTVNSLPPQPVITADGPLAICQGDNVVLTSTEASSYLWSNGETTRSITVTTAGNYTVTVTNASGCQSVVSGTAAVTVNALPSRPTITPAGTVNICTGSSRTLTSSPGSTYLWSNGETTQSIDVSTAGAYTVQVTNSLGCISPPSLATTIVVNPLPATPTITATGSTAICAGSSVTLTSSVSTSYLWSNGATTRSIAVNTAGDYSVRVTDANGCQSLPSAVTAVTVNPLPSAPVIGTTTQATCSVSTGSVALSGLPATGTWTLTRSPGGATQTGTGTTYTVTGLPAGTHTFTVTNANGCTSPASTAVLITTPPAVPTAPVMGTVTQPTCAVTTGSVGISGLPSAGTWTLTRNPGGTEVTGSGTTFTASGIPAGTYTFTVTNAAGCISPASASITVNAPLPVPVVPVHSVNCDGGFNHAVITVSSPTGAGYEYRLNTGIWQTSNIFNEVANGNYTITVRNSSGCTNTGSLFSVNCGCINPPLLTLEATAGSTCGITAVTVSGNTFGGSATSVTITENGGGAVTPLSATASPFAFTYTPTAADAGRTVVITVTTNNPLGSPCAAASATYTLTVNALPVAPVPGTVTQPTCAVPTGSVVLNSLPASGDWTVTRTPGGQTTTGSGTSTTITGLAPGTYNFTVTNANGCVSASSSNVVISAQPDTPTAPVVGDITQPTCALSTGSVALSGLPATGNWTLTRMPGNISITGTGATRTVSAIPPGTYTFTVANAAGCVSPASADVVINLQPLTPPPPVIGTITHPTCELATGSIVLENMPETGEWTLIRYPGGSTSTGTGSSATISSLPAGTYNFAVRNADGCTSGVSANAVINAQPPTPGAPVVGTITHPTFLVGTGSVVLSGLPSSGTWTLIRYPDGFTSQGTGTTRTVSGLEPGTYTFAVTNSVGCTSLPTADVVINARPGAPVVVINNPPTICENETTDLSAPAVTAGSDANLTFTYWTDAGATVAYSTPQAAPAGTYYIMGTSTAGYYTIRPVVVTADAIPVANAGLDQVLDYIFGTTLNAEIPAIGTGIWALVSGTGDLFNSAAPSTAVSGLSTGENVFSWTVTNGACDPVTDLIMVTVNDLRIPTLITPNDDGYNDRFELYGIETLGRTELVIFDRRGLKVWESSSYENDWDGRDFNSNPLPEDTYFWVIRADNGVSRSGYIVIRR